MAVKLPAALYYVLDATLAADGVTVVQTEKHGPYASIGPAKAARTRAARAMNFLGRTHVVTLYQTVSDWKVVE